MFPKQVFIVSVLHVFSVIDQGYSDIIVTPLNFIQEFDQNGHPSNNLTILCTPPAEDNIEGISSILLQKKKIGGTDKTSVASLISNGMDGVFHKGVGLTNRKYNLSGLLTADNPAESFLRVEFQDGSCVDQGEFECSTRFYRKGAQEVETVSHSASVTTKTMPEQALMVRTPTHESYVVNKTVELRCSAQVGFLPAYFRWQFRHTGQGTEEESDFASLTFGVTSSEGPYPQGFCKNYATATLLLRVDQDLNGTEIRCVPVRGIDRYDNLSASFIFHVTEAGCIPECWNGGLCVKNKCQCPSNFTGSFCENAVQKPCEEDCGGTSKSSAVEAGNIISLFVFCLFLLCHMQK